jgi:Xaa-Pro aminopeptidase
MSNRLYLPYAKQMSVIRRTDAVDYDPGSKVERRLRELGLEKAVIGVVGYRGILQTSIPFSVMDHWRRELKGASFVEATDLLHEVRSIKSKEELKWFRKGAALTDMAFEALDKKARAGMTDFELAGVLSNGYMPSGGGHQLIFVGSTSMARPHLIFPNQFPTHRKTRKGDIILTYLSKALRCGRRGLRTDSPGGQTRRGPRGCAPGGRNHRRGGVHHLRYHFPRLGAANRKSPGGR